MIRRSKARGRLGRFGAGVEEGRSVPSAYSPVGGTSDLVFPHCRAAVRVEEGWVRGGCSLPGYGEESRREDA